MKDEFFEKIEKEKIELPTIKKQIKDLENYNYNFYQYVAILTMIICFFGGIIIGNVFPSCISSSLYTDSCTTTEFNIALTILFWFLSFLVCMFIFAVGHIINILSDINKKMKK